ncbi:MAG: hypothetical protein LBF55_04490, partial [Prevotellaceae bacterium]|nr:hypothetical protein [Prevotellaceae bacterium]
MKKKFFFFHGAALQIVAFAYFPAGLLGQQTEMHPRFIAAYFLRYLQNAPLIVRKSHFFSTFTEQKISKQIFIMKKILIPTLCMIALSSCNSGHRGSGIDLTNLDTAVNP